MAFDEMQIRKFFRRIDVHGSGKISAKEIVTFLNRYGKKLSDKQIDEVVIFADADGDGLVSSFAVSIAHLCFSGR